MLRVAPSETRPAVAGDTLDKLSDFKNVDKVNKTCDDTEKLPETENIKSERQPDLDLARSFLRGGGGALY